MHYKSMSDYENCTLAKAREFQAQLVTWRMHEGPLYVCPMGAEPIDGELPLADSIGATDTEPLNLQIKIGVNYLNVASLIRHYGSGSIAEFGHLASSFGKTGIEAIQRLPGFEKAIQKLIKSA